MKSAPGIRLPQSTMNIHLVVVLGIVCVQSEHFMSVNETHVAIVVPMNHDPNNDQATGSESQMEGEEIAEPEPEMFPPGGPPPLDERSEMIMKDRQNQKLMPGIEELNKEQSNTAK